MDSNTAALVPDKSPAMRSAEAEEGDYIGRVEVMHTLQALVTDILGFVAEGSQVVAKTDRAAPDPRLVRR